jgi:hypothetical protein
MRQSLKVTKEGFYFRRIHHEFNICKKICFRQENLDDGDVQVIVENLHKFKHLDSLDLTGNRISRARRRSMVEADPRIIAPFVKATDNALVCSGNESFDFETCKEGSIQSLGLDDDDMRVIVENLHKFKCLRRLEIVPQSNVTPEMESLVSNLCAVLSFIHDHCESLVCPEQLDLSSLSSHCIKLLPKLLFFKTVDRSQCKALLLQKMEILSGCAFEYVPSSAAPGPVWQP